VVAPLRPVPPSWWTRLVGWLPARRRDATDLLNPEGLSPVAALFRAARDASALEFASVTFGWPHASSPAMAFTAAGHAILWVWLADSAQHGWPGISEAAGGGLPFSEATIDWELLLPERPVLSAALPRVSLRRGESATWTDGTRTLNLQASLGVDPPEVYLPPEPRWSQRAPRWAASLRSEVVADLREAGVRVQERDEAVVT